MDDVCLWIIIQNLMSGVVHTSFAALDAHSQTLSDDMQRSLKELEFLVVDVYV